MCFGAGPVYAAKAVALEALRELARAVVAAAAAAGGDGGMHVPMGGDGGGGALDDALSAFERGFDGEFTCARGVAAALVEDAR